MNILTFDIEEWFHLLDNDSTRTEVQWMNYPSRIDENVERILRILDETHTHATFFVIGWIAKQYPHVVRKIAERYEIGSHTSNHQLVWQQSRQEFREDVYASIQVLQDITGKQVRCFRAPGFSIRESEGWAFEVLKECGIEVDCSVFPAVHAHGGMPSFGDPQPSIIKYGGVEMKEFPIGYKSLFGRSVVFSGGGYFRLLPYWLIKRWSRECPEYICSYLHPRDMDAGQPRLPELPIHRKFKSYVGLSGAEVKLRQWLQDFEFIDLEEADKRVDWTKCKVIQLD